MTHNRGPYCQPACLRRPFPIESPESIQDERVYLVVKSLKPQPKTAPERRAKAKDRRETTDRRLNLKGAVAVPTERRQLVRREKVNRRRQIDPTTCEREYNSDELEFMHALETYKRTSGRMFPTCSELLEVFKGLGYRKPDAGPQDTLSDPQRASGERGRTAKKSASAGG